MALSPFIKQNGFNLVEMAIVLAIVGLVFYGVSSNIGEFHNSSKVELSKKKTVNIKRQLLDYAVVNKYLPCPDISVPADGIEDRTLVVTGTGSFDRCSAVVGSVPFADLGLELEDVQDSWGNMIRYAVNQGTDNDGSVDPVEICDKNRAASYFCRQGQGLYSWFTLDDTPPTAANAGTGNYFICNENTPIANCAGVLNANQLEMDPAVAVLVAFNEDGQQTLNNCAGATAFNQNNCDQNQHYHQLGHSSVDGQFFDDVIEGISGYELKREVLTNQTFSSLNPDAIQLAATYQGYDLNAGDYATMNSPQHPDVIEVNRNITTALDLDNGDDVVKIGNNLQSEIIYDNSEKDKIATVDGVLQDGSHADLDAGNGDDTIYIANDAYSSVFLGAGNDKLIIGNRSLAEITGDNGDDEVWVQGLVGKDGSIDLGDGDDVLWLGVYGESGSGDILSGNKSIVGGSKKNEFDVLIFENLTKDQWNSDSSLQNKFDNFELVIFKDNGDGTRDYENL